MSLKLIGIGSTFLLTMLLISCNGGNSDLEKTQLNTAEAKYNLNKWQNKVSQSNNPNGDCSSIISYQGGFLQTTCSGQYRLGLRDPWHSSGHSLLGGLAVAVGSGASYMGMVYDNMGNFGALKPTGIEPDWNYIPGLSQKSIIGIATTDGTIPADIGIIVAISSDTIYRYARNRWSSFPAPPQSHLLSVTFSNIIDAFYLVVQNSDTGEYAVYIFDHDDGTTLHEADLPGDGPYNAIQDHDDGFEVFYNENNPSSGDSVIATSSDAKNWVLQDSSTTQSIIGIVTGNGVKIGVGQFGDVISYSNGQWSKTADIDISFPNFEAQSLIYLNEINGTKAFLASGDLAGKITTLISEKGQIWSNTAAPQFNKVAVGYYSTCAIESETKSLYCWGNNKYGQLGDNDSNFESLIVPHPATSNYQYKNISVGVDFACAIRVGGIIDCWGLNDSGQLGNWTTTNSSVPTEIDPQTPASYRDLQLGSNHACAINTKSQAVCWGNNYYGQLGFPKSILPYSTHPIVSGQVIQVALGAYHTCYRGFGVYSNTAFCMGENTRGQLGNGTRIDTYNAQLVKGYAFSYIAAGGENTCGITANNTAYCWGDNTYGQLGNAKSQSSYPDEDGFEATPQQVLGNFKFKRIYPGLYHTCGIGINDIGYCWGDNMFGELGNGEISTSPMTEPYPIQLGGGAATWANLTVGAYYTCGTTTSGNNYCWGLNPYGQLGVDTRINSPIPQKVNAD